MEYSEQRLFVFYNVHPQRAERTLPIDMVTKRPDEGPIRFYRTSNYNILTSSEYCKLHYLPKFVIGLH